VDPPATGLLADLIGIIRLEILFLLALFSPVLVQLFIIYCLGMVILQGASHTLGNRGVIVLKLIGSPIHELSHALGVLLTLGRITLSWPNTHIRSNTVSSGGITRSGY
jgi:hypothetical protein